MTKFILCLLSATLMVACSKKKSSGGSGDVGRFKGLWMQEEQANELRKTGKIDSVCADKAKNGGTYAAFWNFDEKGNVRLYSLERGQAMPPQDLGAVDGSGGFKPSPMMAKDMEPSTRYSALVSGDRLVMTAALGQKHVDMTFVRSSEEEAKTFYRLQDECAVSQPAGSRPNN